MSGLGGVGMFCICLLSRVESSDCPMGLVIKLPGEAGYVCIYFFSEDVL